MADPSTPDQDKWLETVLGVHVGEVGTSPLDPAAAGTLGGLKRGLASLSAIVDDVKARVTKAMAGVVDLTTQTDATSPTNRARTILGVGEKVRLDVTSGPGTWTVTGGGSLSATNGSFVKLTAPSRPGTVVVSVVVGTVTKSVSFTVIAPQGGRLEVISTEHGNGLPPNAGFRARIYLLPDTVNFTAVEFKEEEALAVGHGSWSGKTGEGHSPNAAWLANSGTVKAGFGTYAANDHCWSGYIPGLSLTDWTGDVTWDIPWTWKCNSDNGSAGRVPQVVTTTSDGTTTITKGQATFTAALS